MFLEYCSYVYSAAKLCPPPPSFPTYLHWDGDALYLIVHVYSDNKKYCILFYSITPQMQNLIVHINSYKSFECFTRRTDVRKPSKITH